MEKNFERSMINRILAKSIRFKELHIFVIIAVCENVPPLHHFKITNVIICIDIGTIICIPKMTSKPEPSKIKIYKLYKQECLATTISIQHFS